MSFYSRRYIFTFVMLLLMSMWPNVGGAQDFAKVKIETTRITDGIFMLQGAGGNIGVSIGDDGVLLIDDEFPELVGKIKLAVADLSPRPIRIVLNTNWHYDHADGNELLAESGAVVIAHENSRAHMLRQQRFPEMDSGWIIQPYSKGALPLVTFHDSVTVHFNGDEIRALYIPNAHSDGDLVVHFKRGNVIHTGDLFFPNAIPFINFTSGGSLDGMIQASDRILEMTDSHTRVIPGHGPLSDRDGVRASRELLVTVRDRLIPLIKAGKTVDEVVLANPLADLYKGRKSYFEIEKLTRYGYMDLKRNQAGF